MRKILVSLAGLALFACPVGALGQESSDTHHMAGPPKIIEIVREDSKPGKSIAHRKHEEAWAQAFAKAGYPYSLTISSATGPDEDWFMTGFDSFAAMEKTHALFDTPKFQQIMETFSPKETDFLAESRFIYAKYRPDLSYKPDYNLGEYKYFNVLTVRYKLGSSPDDVHKVVAAAREKANPDYHQVVYEVTSGMAVNTFLYFTPVKTLATWDEPPNKEYGQALKDGGFSDAVGKTVQLVESRLFSFNPRLSSLPESVTKADPAFWHPKSAVAVKAPAAKATKPAAKKEESKN
jgi:hypothetical protein